LLVVTYTAKDEPLPKALRFKQLFLSIPKNLKPGVARKEVKDYLRDQGIAFRERYAKDTQLSVLVRVGEEDSPWYCSEWLDYVEFEFAAGGAPDGTSDRSDADILQKVLTSSGEGCL
jgi:hypothetical protein